MNIENSKIIAGWLLLQALCLPSGYAQESVAETIIDIAGHQVPVKAGGLYDKYRSNPPLSVIAEQAPEIDLSWFKTIQKTKVDIGFSSYSPNFYYKSSRITAVFTADLAQLRALMPPQILQQVTPLQIWPGRGLIALTAYAYHYCDNDSYNEIALSVITTKPATLNVGPLSLLRQSLTDDYWGYVLKLPVNTELARVRGVVGYNLPKWTTAIDYQQQADTVVVRVADSETTATDFTITAKALPVKTDDFPVVRNSFVNLDVNGTVTTGYALSRLQLFADTSDEEAVKLTLTDGSLSRYIRQLKLGKLMKYEYVPEFQSALYAPVTLQQAQRAADW